MPESSSLPAEAPKRIRRERTRGWRMPEGATYVGRGTKWGNPFVVGAPYFVVNMTAYLQGEPLSTATWKTYTAQDAVDCYIRWFSERVGTSGFALSDEAKTELAGRDLACWCAVGDVCHADYLLEMARG